jgi:hypothetical protein
MRNLNLNLLLVSVVAAAFCAADARAQATVSHPVKSYAEVQALLNGFMKRNKGKIEFAPHDTFWNDMSYRQFVEGNVPGVTGPAGEPLKILVVGNAGKSNIIMALRGTMGSIFDREKGAIGRMPPVGPFMSDEEIDRLADWIDRGCPEGP